MKIIIGADLVPTKATEQYFIDGNGEAIVGKEVLERIQKADFCLYNMEVPLTDVCEPIDKAGPALIAKTSTIAGYKALNTSMVTLCNNHTLDQGEQGLISTMKVLEENGIDYIGVGKNVEEAKKPKIVELGGKKVGIFTCCAHEFSFATETTMGAYAVDYLETPDEIMEFKKQVDYLIVLYHGGKEYFRYGSPEVMKLCRKFVDKGADLVVCQHTHAVGCMEDYNGGKIIYGQGNFCFVSNSDSEEWHTGMLIELDLDTLKFDYIPLQMTEDGVTLGDKSIIDGFYERTEAIKKPGYIDEVYEEFANQKLKYYLYVFAGAMDNPEVAKAWGEGDFKHIKYLLQKKSRAHLINHVECEDHREIFLYAVRKYREKHYNKD